MDYQRIYDKIIDLAKKDYFDNYSYFENHHIIPRSEGGSNKKENKIAVPIKVHHLLHLLLIKMGRCLKYCYFGYSVKDYVHAKMIEKEKKHLL